MDRAALLTETARSALMVSLEEKQEDALRPTRLVMPPKTPLLSVLPRPGLSVLDLLAVT